MILFGLLVLACLIAGGSIWHGQYRVLATTAASISYLSYALHVAFPHGFPEQIAKPLFHLGMVGAVVGMMLHYQQKNTRKK